MINGYLAAIPQTIFSVVRTGKVPDSSSDRSLRIFHDPNTCFNNFPIDSPTIFLLGIQFGKPGNFARFDRVVSRGVTWLQSDSIDQSWIVAIFVSNLASRTMASRLFNDRVPVEIQIDVSKFTGTKGEHFRRKPYTILPPLNDESAITYYKSGDILGSRMEVLVNTVNCVGVMGKGIALAFKEGFPEMYTDYRKLCQRKSVELGKPYLYDDRVRSGRRILNFPTKGHWRENSRLESIERGLEYLAQNLRAWDIRSIAIPALGCGNGKLSWSDVKPLILKHLGGKGLAIEIYSPFDGNKPNPGPGAHQKEIVSFFQPARGKKRACPGGTVVIEDSDSD